MMLLPFHVLSALLWGWIYQKNYIQRANEADFFTWKPTELFDLIFDYTFFCAIERHMRLAWAIRIHELLKPNRELITLMFPLSDHNGGPPYKVSVTDYEDVLSSLGFQAEYIDDNDMAIGSLKGREKKLGRWKRYKSRALRTVKYLTYYFSARQPNIC